MFAAIATVALSATAAYSQAVPAPMPTTPEGVAVGLSQISAECRNAIISLATSPLTQCLSVNTLLPAISADANVVPILDNWMTEICASEPCDQDFLDSAATNFSSACASDLESYNVAASDVEGIFGLYPLVRELVCLKTTEPFESNTTMTSSSTMEEDSASADNSTFCVTSVLEEVSSYLGMNLTVNGIFGLVLGSDTQGREALTQIPQSALCQDCVYSAAGLIEQQYPGIWSQPLINGQFNVSGYLNETCPTEMFPVIDEQDNTITLPSTVYPAAENSTYAYGINYTNGTMNGTYTPSEDVEQPPTLPFANAAAAPINGTSTPVEASSSMMASSTMAAPATSSTGMPLLSMISSALEASATAPLVSVIESAVASATAAPVKRDVTAAKRRWVGQQ